MKIIKHLLLVIYIILLVVFSLIETFGIWIIEFILFGDIFQVSRYFIKIIEELYEKI